MPANSRWDLIRGFKGLIEKLIYLDPKLIIPEIVYKCLWQNILLTQTLAPAQLKIIFHHGSSKPWTLQNTLLSQNLPVSNGEKQRQESVIVVWG